MVALLGLGEPVQVLGDGVVGLPCRSVDPLQLLALLVPSPVGAGHTHQREMAELAGGRDMRSTAQIGELRRVPVGGDAVLPCALRRCVDLVLSGPDSLDDLALERLVAEELQPFTDGVLVPDKGLVLGHDGPHLGADPL